VLNKEKRPTAVIIGLDSPTGLQTARTLSNYRIPVVGIASNLKHPCCRTRACEFVLSAGSSEQDLVDCLKSLGLTLESPAVLVPCTDLSVLTVSRNRESLSRWYKIGLPCPETVELLLDKASFYAYAQKEGIPIPNTFFLHSRDDAATAARGLRFPAILKPSVKSDLWARKAREKAFRISGPEELLGQYERCKSWTNCLIAQDLIEGGDTAHYTCNCYFSKESKPLITFLSRKLRQWPPFGGEACLSVECRNQNVLAETLRLFGRVGFHGLCYLEMKQDQRTGDFLVIEPNIGRPTGRSVMAEASGVELLFTMYCDLLGWSLPVHREQVFQGTKWIHARRDLQSAFHHWRRGDLSVSDWIQSIRGPKMEALFSWQDPVPFFADITRVIGRGFNANSLNGRRNVC